MAVLTRDTATPDKDALFTFSSAMKSSVTSNSSSLTIPTVTT